MDHFDFAFVGGGLSGLLRADRLLDQLKECQRIAIIDPQCDSLKSKTFAFWTKKSDPPHYLSKLVSHRWNYLKITGSDGAIIKESLGDYCYESISGERIFEYLSSKLNGDSRVFRLNTAVQAINDSAEEAKDQSRALIKLESGQEISASHAFISPLKQSPSLLQSFTGFEILTNTDYFDPDTVDLMDFRVPQDDQVRFVYVLPFSARHALVEFTIFSSEIPSCETRESILIDYIKNKLKIESFSILKKETGVIPMNGDPEPLFVPSFNSANSTVIGGAAGMIKPSTGYSFKRNLDAQEKNVNSKYFDLRFRFYDSLMLDLMRTHGGQLSDIFFRLFKNNSVGSIFEFLDEKSSVSKEARIFASLPKLPFILKVISLNPFFFAVVSTFLLNLTIGGLSVWIIPILGLLTVGIGHGALDHLIDPAAEDRPFFLVKYLGAMVLFFLLWHVLPDFALAFFVFQSANHFGESYWVRTLRRSSRDKRVSVLVWLWGLFAATFGVLFHWTDSLPIIQMIVGNRPMLVSLPIGMMRGLSIFLFFVAATASWILDNYHRKATGRLGQGLPATLLLGLSSMSLPLLPGFFCFFAFWHAIDSSREQCLGNGWSLIEYTKKSLPFTLVAHAGIALFILIFANATDFNVLWKIVFIAIGALTAAHSPVMTRFLFQGPKRKMPWEKQRRNGPNVHRGHDAVLLSRK
ncbi:MAG: beta-carotene 15,15'-dioxygenase, Brp/Blh family [Proteobacteria bacterium]|nr:beta-carotene 15,15'-dioxygenase, Brp/Blh family [Pseudomonadota bacterium]